MFSELIMTNLKPILLFSFFPVDVLEIYRLSQRIQKSAVKVGVETRLENIFFEISTLWETLSAFLLGTCVSVSGNYHAVC